jgi:hypothetical protein
MSKNSIVTINGQQYDALTGLPIKGSSLARSKKSTPSVSIHSPLQKSQTLIRRVTKKPSSVPASRPKFIGNTMDIARSSKISRFAPHPVTPPQSTANKKDLEARHHPLVDKVNKAHSIRQAQKATHASKSAQDIKHEAIAAALARPIVRGSRRSFLQRHPRTFVVTVISLLVILVGGYFTYINLPSLSVKIAAVQAGIDATYPDYRPDGYSLDGPVTFSDGQVTMNFSANTGTSKFSIKESKSTWDSSATLDNVVRPKVGEKYITNQEHGLTIYTYDGNAAWVNGGILYTIEGDAPISGDQLRRIATSL